MSFSVTILGSSSAIPTKNRSLTAHLVNHDERFFLIDCGEGTQIQLKRFDAKFTKINHIFISHLHGDHVFGLFGLLSTLSMLGRKTPLNIYANGKLKDILESHFAFFNETISYPIIYNQLDAKTSQQIYDDGKLEVHTIPLKHRIPCVGFIFKEKQKERNIKKFAIEEYGLGIKDILNIKKGADFTTESGKVISNEQLTTAPPTPLSYAYCTDTKASESILPFIKNVDVLYHEATFLDEDQKLAKATYHSTAKQAAQLASKANVKGLVIGHLSQRYKHEKRFVEEASEVFANTIMAADGLTIDLAKYSQLFDKK